MSEDAHWIVNGEVGLRIFPRVGSQTLLKTYTYNQSRVKWLACHERYIVVRNPWERLLSVWGMFWPPHDFNMVARGYPDISSLDELLIYSCSLPQSKMDLHLRSMHSQLDGVPISGVSLVSLAYIIKNPVTEVSEKARGMHLHRTTFRPSTDHSAELYARWRGFYNEDWKMWAKARKLPNER